MYKEHIFPSSGLYHSQLLLQFLHFWFKIITPTIQTDTGEWHFLDEITDMKRVYILQKPP
jgi:hypothetical protein